MSTDSGDSGARNAARVAEAIFAYYPSLGIHRVSTNRKNPRVAPSKSNLTPVNPSRGSNSRHRSLVHRDTPHTVGHATQKPLPTTSKKKKKEKRSFDFIECCKRVERFAFSIEHRGGNLRALPRDRFRTASPSNLCLFILRAPWQKKKETNDISKVRLYNKRGNKREENSSLDNY